MWLGVGMLRRAECTLDVDGCRDVGMGGMDLGCGWVYGCRNGRHGSWMWLDVGMLRRTEWVLDVAGCRDVETDRMGLGCGWV